MSSLDHGSKLRSPSPKALEQLNSATLIFIHSQWRNGGSPPAKSGSRPLAGSYKKYILSISIVVVVSFAKGRNESCQSLRQVGLLYDRWRYHLSPPPQFWHGTGREGDILQPPAPVASATIAHKTFETTDLTSAYSVCTRRVFGSIGHRTQTLRMGA
ncbi:uncharacterized protein TNCV_3192651 [Trichonephila clavipes]|nr:uncharacterized protein TNCV_3192651 [Trichonephila clavipes]